MELSQNQNNQNSESIDVLKNRLINNDFTGLISAPVTDTPKEIPDILSQEEKKICIKCKKQKNKALDFSILRRRPDGYRDVCKKCECEYAKRRYEETKRYRRARIKLWKIQNPDKVKIHNRQSYEYRLRRFYKEEINNFEKNRKIFYDPMTGV